jgi:predicted PurR-regulated permease PerM
MEGGQNITININSGTIIRAILFILMFFAIYFFKDLILVLLTSVVVASAIEPAVAYFKKSNIPRLPSVILVYLFLAVFFITLFYAFIPPLFGEVSNFVGNLPKFVNEIDLGGSLTKNQNLSFLNPAVEGLSNNISLAEIVGQFQKIVSNATEGFWKTISVVFGGVLSFVLIVVISFYLAVQENGIDNFLKIITPARHQDYIVNLWKRSQRKIGLWMQGQLILALIIGVLVYLGLAILDIKYAFLLAVLAAVFEIIPLFGPILAAIPAVILGFSEGGLATGFVVIGLYLIIQQFENHLIFPLVVKKVTGLPAIFVIISLIIGSKLAGFLGMVLSVPIATALVEFISDLEVENKRIMEEQIASESK